MALFDIIRLASLSTVLLFSLIVLGISGNAVSLAQGLSTVANFALAVAVMTLVFVLPVLLISMLRRGSFLSWVAVEFGLVGFMWIMWLASASYTTSMSLGLTISCDSRFLTSEAESICRQYQAVQAFAWLNWLIFFTYLVVLIVFVVKALRTGRSIWTSEITDLSTFAAEGSQSTANMANTNKAGYPTMASQPPPQQYQQAPYNQGGAAHV